MLLMIPGPIEVSPAVVEAFGGPPPGHVSAQIIEAHGASIEKMRQVWCAGPTSQPFIMPGGGTLAMDVAVANTASHGDTVVVVNTGYFSDRLAEMLRRRGADVRQVTAEPGFTPSADDVRRVVADAKPVTLYATHVDTSTGVRVNVRELCEIAQQAGALTVFDGVCATAAERFEMESWGADVYVTASQKAIGLPAGLALMVVSEPALARRRSLRDEVPMALDWEQWLPIMQAYEDRRASYFSTPATNHIAALDVSLSEILEHGMDEVFQRHQRVADQMRAAWTDMGLELLCEPGVAANTLSAVRYPAGVGPELVGKIKERGIIVAGGLYPGLKQEYFRVGHMGYSTTQPDHIERTIDAIRGALKAP